MKYALDQTPAGHIFCQDPALIVHIDETLETLERCKFADGRKRLIIKDNGVTFIPFKERTDFSKESAAAHGAKIKSF